ncbi:MAG: DNA gyrase modulator, partial [Candidatus Alcyoniella australis]|nr:DNA gyrase modulator [Candidatus Alcyoniella australis]
MDIQQLKQFAQKVVDRARAAGADQAEAWTQNGRDFSVRVRDGAIEDITQATSKGVGLRVYAGKRLGFASSTDFSDEAVEAMVGQAVAMAREVSDDDNHGLPSAADLALRNASIDLYDEQTAALTPEWKIETALEMERIVRAFDPRISNIDEVGAGDYVGAVAFANSLGVSDGYRGTSVWLSCAPLAKSGDE